MRKFLISFVLLVTGAFAVISLSSHGLPQAENFSAVYESGNTVFAAENRALGSFIYEIRSGTVTKVYSYPRGEKGALASITAVYGDKGNLFAVRDIPELGIRQLLSAKAGSSLSFKTNLPYEKDTKVRDFYMQADAGFLTLSDSQGGVSVLSSANVNSENWIVSLVQSAPAAGSVECAFYRGGVLYIMYSGGQAVSVGSYGLSSVSEKDFPESPNTSYSKISMSARMESKSKYFLSAFILLAGVCLPLSAMFIFVRKAKSYVFRTGLILVGSLEIFAFISCFIISLRSICTSPAVFLPALIIKLVLALLAFAALSSLVVFLVLRSINSPLKDLSLQMSRVSDGDYTVSPALERHDEIGEMSRRLQELCVALSIRDYEVYSTMRSYHRFVPGDLEQLLDRASVMEVSLGDNRAINGSAGIITVCNRSTVRGLLNDKDYVSFLNHSSSLMDLALRSNGGLLLSSGYDMESNMVYFHGGAGEGVKSALSLTGIPAAPDNLYPPPKFMVILHKTLFIYGMAGNEESMFPYVSSSELEFLGGFADRLRSAGVQIAVTEQYLHGMGDRYFARYIGFISSDDGKESFKLYELLDPLSDIERNLRISYDSQFQEAISMFYRSDFYLARNAFSAILRACPSDGVARWYLFACEHLFNRDESEKSSFALFGVEVD